MADNNLIYGDDHRVDQKDLEQLMRKAKSFLRFGLDQQIINDSGTFCGKLAIMVEKMWKTMPFLGIKAEYVASQIIMYCTVFGTSDNVSRT